MAHYSRTKKKWATQVLKVLAESNVYYKGKKPILDADDSKAAIFWTEQQWKQQRSGGFRAWGDEEVTGAAERI